MKKYLFLVILFGVPFHSCTTSREMADNQQSSGHYRLYTFPDKPAPHNYDPKRYKKITIVSSNDFDGNIEPETIPIKNRYNEARNIKVGGVSAMRAYLDILKTEYENNLLYVDSGSFLNKEQNHRETIFYYNYLGVDIASFGINEFQIKEKSGRSFQDYFESLMKPAKFSIVNSNLFDLTKAKQIDWDGVEEYSIKTVNGLKVGFLGVLTTEQAEQIPDGKINGIYIQNPPKNIITKANLLRRKGAQIIVLLASKGLDCTSALAHEEKLTEEKVNFFPSESNHCNTYKNELYKSIKQLPPKTIDLIITSGEKSKVANMIAGYPTIQNKGEGKYFSRVELFYDLKHNVIDTDKTVIHQPVQLCHQFLKEYQDCYTQEDISNQEVIPATFLGKEVKIKELPKG